MRGVTSDGNQAGWLDPKKGKDAPLTSTISQNINFASAGAYILNYDSFTQPQYFEHLYGYNVTITEIATGTDVLNLDLYENPSDGAWTNRSHNFNVSGGNYNLSFNASGAPLYLAASAADIFIDNTAIVPVPEPSSALLSALGLVGLVCRRSRK